MAEELGKTVGDTLKIRAGGETQTFTVNGIYQDVTSGGRTAKTARAFPSETAEKYSYKITLSPALPMTLPSICVSSWAGDTALKTWKNFSFKPWVA